MGFWKGLKFVRHLINFRPMTQVTSVGVQYSQYPTSTPGIASLAAACAAGFSHVIVNLPEFVSESLDAAELSEFGSAASEFGVLAQFGVGCVGPVGGHDDVVAQLGRRIEAGRDAGSSEFFAYTRCERTGSPSIDIPTALGEQLEIIERNLRSLTPVLRAHGARLNLKTHEDLSSYEVERIVARLDPTYFGVSLDVANLVVRGEDPAEVSHRLAGLIRQTHLEDVALYPVAEGVRRRLRPVGDGVLDWEAILAPLVGHGMPFFTLEHHRGRFDTPVFDRSWFVTEPHVTGADVGQLFRMAISTREGVGAGRIPSLSALDTEVDPEELHEQLRRGKDFLLATLSRIAAQQNPSIEEVS